MEPGRSRTASPRSRRSRPRAAPGEEGGPRPRLPRRIRPRPGDGRRADLRDGLRLLPRSERCAPPGAAADDADLVLGSRYVPGGGTRNWGLLRRFISRGGSLYAQVLLQLGVRDLTGGFKCYRREVLERIDLDAISLARLCVPDRDDVPGDPSRLPGRRGADHVRRPRGRRLEDEQGDRARGCLEGARAARRALFGRL